MKYDNEWCMAKGFKIIRMNRSSNCIEMMVKYYDRPLSWATIGEPFKEYKTMYDRFTALLADQYTLQADEKN